MEKNKVNLDDESLNSIATLMGELLDKQTAVLATKEELWLTRDSLRDEIKSEIKESESSLKTYIHEGIETVMDGLGGRVDKLEEDVKELKLNRSTT